MGCPEVYRFAPSMASAAAQGLGLLQIVVLFWGRGATTESDLYFLLFLWTQVGYQLVLAGIVYPIWLRGHGASAPTVRLMAASTIPLAVISAGCGLLVWVGSGHSQSGASGIAILFAFQGVFASAYWIGALWISSQGGPLFVSGATLLPNLTAVALGMVAALLGADRVAPIIVGQCAGFLAGLAALVYVHGNVWRHAWHWTSRTQGVR